jgi:ATP-dependent DNA helicase DinG
MYDQLIHDHFPHRDASGRPSYRPRQFETIREVLTAFDDDNIKDVIVEAPTGAGKTSIAVTVARIMTIGFEALLPMARHLEDTDITEAMEIVAPKQAHLITSMKLLQDAYLGDDPNIKLVKGKGNYECRRNPQQSVALAAMSAAVRGVLNDFSCDDAEQMFGRMCDKRCPYKEARKRARWSPIALHNFDSFFYQVTLGKAFTPRGLLTIDEAHNTEEKIRNLLTVFLNRSMFESVSLNWTDLGSEDIEAATQWASEHLKEVVRRSKDIGEELTYLRGGKQGPREIERMAELSKKLKLIEGVQQKLDRFCKSRTPLPDSKSKPADWVVTIEGRGAVILEPVNAGRWVHNALMRYGDKRLHMSATFMNNGGAYNRAIKLKLASATFIDVPSTFPKERRPIVKRSAGPLGAKNWKENFPAAVDQVKAILKENPGVRGVMHCTSYKMAEEFSEALSGERRLVKYDRRNREVVVSRFTAGFEAKDAVLLAVSLTEGYDFKDDLCRFQILIRVPYPVPDKCMTARKEKDPRFYGWRTCLTLVQTYGRGMRSADDFCKTYMLDGRFSAFVSRDRDQLPNWFLEAING